MNAERWRRLDRIFVEALQQPSNARIAFVNDQTQDDEGLRAEVLSLLSAENASGAFMAASAFERLAQVVGTHGWTLASGERIGAYTVLGLVGSGGAGEVWSARDDRLGRDVAIKVLLPHLSDDPSRLRRFADEARAVGALNHPNIVAVYDVGNHGDTPFIVSELLEGQSLRTRLESGAMRVAEVVAIAAGVARGLAAAHARGIVHRDLKPENVFLGRTGVPKILDFGVAKLQRTSDTERVGADTITGMILGTAGYMAPEQVRGEETDARADLFALGVMLYEMLSGTAPFKRASTIETLHAILTVEPADLTDGARSLPFDLSRIVMRLLQKDRELRFQSAVDLVWALEQTNTMPGTVAGGVTTAPPPSSRWTRRAGLALAVAAVAGALWTVVPRGDRSTAGTDVTRFSWALPAGVGLASAPAVSPDGRRVAFVGANSEGSRLFIRPLNAFDAQPVDGSEGARQPFWSPDSQWVGFFARGRVMKVSTTGGAPVVVADDNRTGVGNRRMERGGAWSSDGWIVYGASFNPSLFALPAAGGVPKPATMLLGDRAEHRFPWLLPDGRSFLYQVRAGATEGRGVFVGALGTTEAGRKRILAVDSNAIYAPTFGQEQGVLLYVANGRIEAQRFDPARRATVGPAQPLSMEAGSETFFHPAAIGASSSVLAYASQLAAGRQIKVIRQDGSGPSLINDRQEQQWPRISHDGTRMAWLQIELHEGADIWVQDLARRTRTRVTTTPGRDLGHVWSPDGLRLAYLYDLDKPGHLRLVAADGSGASQDVECPRVYCEPTDWSSDGRELVVNSYEASGTDVWAIAVATGGTSRPLLETRFNERDARLSPDRRWIAYVSDETGRPEVSIRRVDGSVRRYTVSTGGGDQVVWQRDGRALYWVEPTGRLRKVSVQERDGGLRFGASVELPVTIGTGHSNTQYDVAADGRIYYLDPAMPSRPTEIRLVLDWQALLK
ncbi:MAG TPA: protein kinase [Vicinamibacterales bacterium]|nr:protein kinase [Vicinamibacterales bacterium]